MCCCGGRLNVSGQCARLVTLARDELATHWGRTLLSQRSICITGGHALGRGMRGKVSVAENEFGTVGAEHIARGLEKNATVKVIKINGGLLVWLTASLAREMLQGNNIGTVGAEHIARALEKNTTITEIDMYHELCGGSGRMLRKWNRNPDRCCWRGAHRTGAGDEFHCSKYQSGQQVTGASWCTRHVCGS